MKKILSIFALLLTIVVGAKADTTLFSYTTSTQDNTAGTYDATPTGCTFQVGVASKYESDKGIKLDGDSGTKYVKVNLASGETLKAGDVITIEEFASSNPGGSDYGVAIGTTAFTAIKNLYLPSGKKNVLTEVSYEVVANDGLAGQSSFYAFRCSGKSTYINAVTITRTPAGPTITQQPQDAAYVSGATIDALTVEATASAGTLTYQWYSCDDADKTNASAINGATSASYTPSAAGFYFVNVKDNNGNVDSDVAQITVSEAEAPTISVSGTPAEVVKVGTEVILTATATGVPTPTITWYNSSDEPVATEESTELAYTVPTNTAGTYTFYAVASNGVEPNATSAEQTVVVKEQVAKPTITPNGAYFEESQSVEIASATEDAVIEYSTDGGESWTAYTEALNITETTTIIAKATKQDYLNSETATATFTKVTLDPQVDVTGAASWDWSKFGTKEIKLTDQTTPSKTTEFVLSNAVNYGLCASIGSEFGNAQQLKVTTEYVVRDTKYFQGPSIKFNTTVPGKITVVYSNTGNREKEEDRRFLNVNGINYGVGTMKSNETTTTTVSVAAGEVAITGKFGPSVENQDDQYLRINSITFTPTTTETVTIPTEGVATYVTKSALDFSTVNGTIKAYAVTDIKTESVATAEVTQVPAGTPLLIKGAEGDYDIEIVESASPVDNLLKISTGTVTGEAGNVYAYSKSALKFKKVAATVKVPAGKCYLQITTPNAPASLDIDFDGEATGVNGVAEAKAEVAPVKVIKNGQLFIGNYNVAGARVK